MQTLWGQIAVADAHVHFFSRSFLRQLAVQKGGSATPADLCVTLGWEPPPETAEQCAAQWAAELVRNEVSQATLIASLPGEEDSVLAAVAAFPGRFFGWFFLNPIAPDAKDRCERGFRNGLKAVCLLPAMHNYSLGDARVEEIFRTAANWRGTVFVHCGVLSVGFRQRLGLPCPFDMRYSNPLDLHPLALKYPGVHIVIPHFGAGFFREALMLADMCPNVYLDTSSSNAWTRYLTPPPTLEQVFRQALAVVGPRRLLFGTDSSYFPRGWHKLVFDDQVNAMWKVGIRGDDAADILGGNLRSLMRGR